MCVQELSRHQVNCDRTQQTQQGQGVQDRETAQVVRRLAESSITVRQGDLYQVRSTHTETHRRKPTQSCEDFHAIDTNPNHGQVQHRSSPPGRLQPALTTGTQGEVHGIGIPPPLVGRLGASGELGSPHKMSKSHSITGPR